ADRPFSTLVPVEKSVVQAFRALDPEFDRLGNDAEAVPEERTWHVPSLEFFFVIFETTLQCFPGIQNGALVRGPCPQTALAGARAEIGVGLRFGNHGDLSTHPHLAPEFLPVEGESRIGAFFKRLRLG